MRQNVHFALILLFSLAGTAWAADRVAEVEITQNYIVPPPIVVKANQIGYTQATTHKLDWSFGLSGHCTSGNHLVSSWLWLTPDPTGDRWSTAYDFKWLSEKSIFERVSNRGVNLSSADKAKAVKACNDFLAEQMARGKSKAWLLSREHKIPGPLLYLANHAVECQGNACPGCVHNEQSKNRQIELLNPVICQKSPLVVAGSLTLPPRPPIPPGPQDLKQVFGVTEAKLWVNPKQASVVTQAKLTVHAEITVNGPGKVKYRVVHNGGKGPLNTLNFSKAKTAPLSFPLTVQCPTSSGNSSNKTTKKGASGTSGGIGGLAAAPSNVKNGTLRLEIVLPRAGKRESNVAAYSVTCKKTGTIATPLPDLKIVSAQFVPPANFSGHAQAVMVVRNGGAAGAGQNEVKVQGTANGMARSWTGNIPPLAKGQQIELKVDLLARGQVTGPVQIRIDATHKVKESNESNNVKSVQ
jgi:hypothetical protein